MAYTDPRRNAKFVDDNHLRGRDNSGGAQNREMRHSTDFGETGASVKGGEAAGSGGGMDEDEIVMPKGSTSSRKGTQAGY